MVRSVADDLRREQLEDQRHLTPAERIALALKLGARDLATFEKARGLGGAEAILLLRRERQEGRRASSCAAP